jgi:hypothetical protein
MREFFVLTVFLATTALAQEEPSTESQAPEAPAETNTDGGEVVDGAGGGVRNMLGMSILGNEEAPKALVIVPWKSSQIGDGLGVSDSMDDRARPVDREVFMRELRYYELRAGSSEQ